MGRGEAHVESSVTYFVTVRTFACKSVFHEESSASTLVDVMETLRRQEGFKKYGYVVLPDHYHVLLGGGADSQSVADVRKNSGRSSGHRRRTSVTTSMANRIRLPSEPP